MNEFVFTLKTASDSISLRMESEQSLYSAEMDILSLFPGVDFENHKIEALHYNTPEFKEAILEFIDTHKHKYPVFNALAAFINRLLDNEPFYFIPFMQLTTKETIVTNEYLNELNGKIPDYKEAVKQVEELFGPLMEQYDIMHYGETRKKIGESDKNKRICRFCKKMMPEVQFKNTAHAISEALGNKTLILLEECDSCNAQFASTIEPQLIEYFSFMRTLYGIKGKGGVKKFEGKNFLFENEGSGLKISYESGDDSPAIPEKIVFESNHTIANQDLYRTLVKYLLSVIPGEHLPIFEKTISWVRGEFDIPSLPVLAHLFAAMPLEEQPTLTIYLRRNENTELPFAVGELNFALSKYVFIIPCASKDKRHFVSEEEYQRFWKTFTHFTKIPGWGYENWSSTSKKPFVINLNIETNDSVTEGPTGSDARG